MLAEGIRVSKSNPCPVCQKHDWCYAIGTGDTTRILCTRLKRDSLLLPDYLFLLLPLAVRLSSRPKPFAF